VVENVTSFVAECFWPDVQRSDLEDLDRRVHALVADGSGDGSVRYLGSLLLREDEVVLCHFEGDAETVRKVAEQAEIPFARILETTRSPRPTAEPN
jgi:hypothetical protein